jgi:hypothetical protein
MVLVVLYSSFSCYFSSLKSEYFPLKYVFKYPLTSVHTNDKLPEIAEQYKRQSTKSSRQLHIHVHSPPLLFS